MRSFGIGTKNVKKLGENDGQNAIDTITSDLRSPSMRAVHDHLLCINKCSKTYVRASEIRVIVAHVVDMTVSSEQKNAIVRRNQTRT